MTIIEQVMARFGAEDRNQYEIIKYCDSHEIPIWHVPNNTFTKSRFAKVKNKLLGVRPGIPDLFILVGGRLIVIEVKSLGGRPSAGQKLWLARLIACGIPATVANTVDAAIAFIEYWALHPDTRENPLTDLSDATIGVDTSKPIITFNIDGSIF